MGAEIRGAKGRLGSVDDFPAAARYGIEGTVMQGYGSGLARPRRELRPGRGGRARSKFFWGHGRLLGLHGPADDEAGDEVDHDRQIGAALVGADVGDVGHPVLGMCLRVKPAIERVVDRQGWLTSILAGASVAAPRPDAGKPRQPRNPVGTAARAPFRHIVVKLAKP
jgi:hypothetical protein